MRQMWTEASVQVTECVMLVMLFACLAAAVIACWCGWRWHSPPWIENRPSCVCHEASTLGARSLRSTKREEGRGDDVLCLLPCIVHTFCHNNSSGCWTAPAAMNADRKRSTLVGQKRVCRHERQADLSLSGRSVAFETGSTPSANTTKHTLNSQALTFRLPVAHSNGHL